VVNFLLGARVPGDDSRSFWRTTPHKGFILTLSELRRWESVQVWARKGGPNNFLAEGGEFELTPLTCSTVTTCKGWTKKVTPFWYLSSRSCYMYHICSFCLLMYDFH